MAPLTAELDSPVKRGGVIGSATWLLGLLLTYLLTRILSSETLAHYIEIEQMEGVLYLYIMMHVWLLDSITRSSNAIYALLPIALLIGAGYTVATTNQSHYNSSVRGAAVTIGYLPLAVATTILVHDSRLPFRPLVPFVWAGLIFPVVFGAIGGTLTERM